MAIRTRRRRAVLAKHGRRSSRADTFFEQCCRSIQSNQLIPIIGDTIRIAHIFDVNDDQDVGDEDFIEEQLEGQDGLDFEDDAGNGIYYEGLNVTEELAQWWAREVNYPLTDRYRIARVAQFHKLVENPIIAKENYLAFLKGFLLDVAWEIAQDMDDVEEMAYVQQLKLEHTLCFSDIVTELDYPQFPEGKGDPLSTLARLPLKIYLTTSYYNFIERELEAAGKHPKSRMCFWNGRPLNLASEHEPDPAYIPDVNNPVVYHLFGMEQYPRSLVLSEDDYLDFLWALARDKPGNTNGGERIIPPYLQTELNRASLLLLGYRLGDWDLRALFRVLMNTGLDIEPEKRRLSNHTRRPSTAIQISLKDQPLVEDKEKAELYLKEYFKQAQLDVRFGDSDQFVRDLWREWLRWSQGTDEV